MQTRYIYLLTFVLSITDLLFLNLAFYLSAALTGHYFQVGTDTLFRYYLPLANVMWLLGAGISRLYARSTMDRLEDIYRASLHTYLLHAALFSFSLLVTADAHSAEVFLYSLYVQLGGLLLISRFCGAWLEHLLIQRFPLRKSVAVMGKNEGGKELARYFKAHEKNFRFEGFLSEGDIQLLGKQGEVSAAALRQFRKALDKGIQEVYISLPPDKMEQAAALVEEGERMCLRIKLVPDLRRNDKVPYEVSFLGALPVVSIRQEPAYDIANRFKKRVFDLLFSSLVILFVLSWLYPLLALLIKLESRGPVLFRQLRSGRDNREFWCYKFRSMRVNHDSDLRQASRDDDRITRIGRFLRRTSLDELPQFFNVFQGDMSIVGPRPHMLKHTEQYRALIDKYMVRQFLKPGITGWAQVNGYRGETRDPHLMERRVAHDIWYMENWSLMLDVRIVFMTIINVLAGEENAH